MSSTKNASVHKEFFTEFKTLDYLRPIDEKSEAAYPEKKQIIDVLQYSLRSIIKVIGLPRIIALSHYLEQLMNSYLQKESIDQAAEQLIGASERGEYPAPGEKPKTRKLSKARIDAARKAFEAELHTEKGTDHAWKGTYAFLASLVGTAGMENAPADLLCQGIILIWSAFEAFFRDMLCNYLNRNPSEGMKLVASPKLKSRLPPKGIAFDVLSEYKFDVSNRMGDILTGYIDFSNLDALREIVAALLSNDQELRALLKKRDLGLLNQRRHLLVHCAGYVDSRYQKATGEKLTLGSKLRITPEELRTYLVLVRDIAVRLIDSL